MEWISVEEKFPDEFHPYMVLIDLKNSPFPFLGSYRPHTEKLWEKGFYSGDGEKVKRVLCTHYIILPKYPNI